MGAASFDFPLRLGFGCSGAWGQRWFDERQARAVLARAIERGVRCVDTAGFYAGGEAERRLGVVLRDLRASVFVSTKTGTRYESSGARKDFSEAAIRADVSASLQRLHCERLDLLYLHGPSSTELAQSLPALARLREEGKIARWGVCGEGRGLEEAVEAGADAIMGVYNFLNRRHAPVFAKAKAHGLGVVAIAPLAQGLYRRGFFEAGSAADLWRIARALLKNREELARARAARPILEAIEGYSPAQAALAFVHANPDIDVAVTTTTSLGRLEETLVGVRKVPPADLVRALSDLDAYRAEP
ncbi:MAG: aldo/keto reductase [Parvularculaceae bacterium]|nr:aldo/keto reductase [Parvularculaceae bacterium]